MSGPCVLQSKQTKTCSAKITRHVLPANMFFVRTCLRIVWSDCKRLPWHNVLFPKVSTSFGVSCSPPTSAHMIGLVCCEHQFFFKTSPRNVKLQLPFDSCINCFAVKNTVLRISHCHFLLLLEANIDVKSSGRCHCHISYQEDPTGPVICQVRLPVILIFLKFILNGKRVYSQPSRHCTACWAHHLIIPPRLQQCCLHWCQRNSTRGPAFFVSRRRHHTTIILPLSNFQDYTPADRNHQAFLLKQKMTNIKTGRGTPWQ